MQNFCKVFLIMNEKLNKFQKLNKNLQKNLVKNFANILK